MDYKRLSSFKISADKVIVFTDPAYVASNKLNAVCIFKKACDGLVSLIDNYNLILLSIDAPDKLRVEIIKYWKNIPIDLGHIAIVYYEDTKILRDLRLRERVFDNQRAILSPTQDNDYVVPVFGLANATGETIGVCAWRGAADAIPDKDYIFRVFNGKNVID